MAKELTHTASVDDLIKASLENPAFREGFYTEYNQLASAAALIEARQMAGLTQQELAMRAKLPQTTIARIERGHNTSIATLTKLANALGKKVTVAIT